MATDWTIVDIVRGWPVRCRMRDDGQLRPETWRDRWASALAEAFWPYPKYVVTAIDRDAGTITLGDR
jgi:hypothetical protein